MSMANSPSGAPQSSQVQLHDIHVPEQVTNFPIAPGWWILLALIFITALLMYKKYKAHNRLNASKKSALLVLEKNPSLSAKECITLLKWASMQYFNRQQLAKLYGDAFQAFLIEQLPEKYQAGFTDMSQGAFKEQYQSLNASSEDVDSQCYQATKLWLTYALPVKNAKGFNL